MYSVSFFRGLLAELVSNRIVLVPCADITNFRIYCRIKGVTPCGGALVQNNDGMSQYLYL